MALSSRSQHGNPYLFATENAVNHRDLGQKAFENRVNFDDTADTRHNANVIVYVRDRVNVAWYDTVKKHGYICARGMA